MAGCQTEIADSRSASLMSLIVDSATPNGDSAGTAHVTRLAGYRALLVRAWATRT
jgi:hypothetical protein